jgi:hypothetical protein
MECVANLTIGHLLVAYRNGSLNRGEVLGQIREQAQVCRDDNICIQLLSEAETEPYLETLAQRDPGGLFRLPLPALRVRPRHGGTRGRHLAQGFICEPCALENAVDITAHGGWRAWLVRQDRSVN